MSASSLQADLFKGTAQYYAKYRPGLPEEVASHLKQRFNLDGTGTLLDMGCGTGQSTFALAPLFQRTVAFDTDHDMLLEAEKNQPSGLNIVWQQRSDKDVTTAEGPYKMAIACRSFNWMDQYPLLGKLHHILEPGGGVALIGDGSFWTGSEAWQKRVKEVIQSFLGQERRAGKTTYSAPDEPYVVTLEKNGYMDPHLETIPVTREWDITGITGYLYSTSFAARHLFGDKIGEFERALKSELISANDGKERFIERAEFTIQSGFNGMRGPS